MKKVQNKLGPLLKTYEPIILHQCRYIIQFIATTAIKLSRMRFGMRLQLQEIYQTSSYTILCA